MAKKNRLQSGSYRIQRRYKGDDGKTHLKSFTARSKAEAEAMAAEWEAERSRVSSELTVHGAVKRYIAVKESVLSPATVRGYMAFESTKYDNQFGYTPLIALKPIEYQLWISDLTMQYSPKTVRNIASLTTAAIHMFMPKFDLDITLPQKKKVRQYCPSDKDIEAMLASTNDDQLRAGILLGALGSMRRSEICALSKSDILDGRIRVEKAMVLDKDNQWVIKVPKEDDSWRTVPMRQDVLEFLRSLPDTDDGRLLSLTPSQLTDRFRRHRNRLSIPRFRLHDTRHFFASWLDAHNIPGTYIDSAGGWAEGSQVRRKVYTNIISLEQKKQEQAIVNAFSGMKIM